MHQDDSFPGYEFNQIYSMDALINNQFVMTGCGNSLDLRNFALQCSTLVYYNNSARNLTGVSYHKYLSPLIVWGLVISQKN